METGEIYDFVYKFNMNSIGAVDKWNKLIANYWKSELDTNQDDWPTKKNNIKLKPVIFFYRV